MQKCNTIHQFYTLLLFVLGDPPYSFFMSVLMCVHFIPSGVTSINKSFSKNDIVEYVQFYSFLTFFINNWAPEYCNAFLSLQVQLNEQDVMIMTNKSCRSKRLFLILQPRLVFRCTTYYKYTVCRSHQYSMWFADKTHFSRTLLQLILHDSSFIAPAFWIAAQEQQIIL